MVFCAVHCACIGIRFWPIHKKPINTVSAKKCNTYTHNSLRNNMAFVQWLWYKGISHLIEAYENATVTNNILQWIWICFGLTHWNGPAQSFGKSFGSDALYQRWRVVCQSMDGFPGVPPLGLFWGKKHYRLNNKSFLKSHIQQTILLVLLWDKVWKR